VLHRPVEVAVGRLGADGGGKAAQFFNNRFASAFMSRRGWAWNNNNSSIS
jgi:hypothetical protein